MAAALGWMLESMDVMLYSLVLTYMMRDLGMNKSTAGLLGSLMLVAAVMVTLQVLVPEQPPPLHPAKK